MIKNIKPKSSGLLTIKIIDKGLIETKIKKKNFLYNISLLSFPKISINLNVNKINKQKIKSGTMRYV